MLTPMVYDIATADHMYNSNGFVGDTRTGDNTYKHGTRLWPYIPSWMVVELTH